MHATNLKAILIHVDIKCTITQYSTAQYILYIIMYIHIHVDCIYL